MATSRLRELGFTHIANQFDDFVRACIGSQTELISRFAFICLTAIRIIYLCLNVCHFWLWCLFHVGETFYTYFVVLFSLSGENDIMGDPSASKHEATSRQQMLDGLIQQAVDLEEFAKPSPVRSFLSVFVTQNWLDSFLLSKASGRLSELQLKVKELETHSEGGPYQELLLAIRRGVDHAQVLLFFN